MNRFDKFSFNVFYNNRYYGVNTNCKKSISCRVYNDLYKFIVSHYNGTFADFLDKAMLDYTQKNAKAYVDFKYKK